MPTVNEKYEIEIKAKLDKALSGMRKLDSRVKKLQMRLKKASGAMKAFGRSAGIAAAAAVFAFKKLLNSLDEIAKKARSLNLTTTQLQGLQFAFEQGGVSAEKMNKAIFTLQKNIGEAGKGTKTYTDALDGLGLSFEELDRLSPDKQLEIVIDRLKEVGSNARRAQIGSILLGRAYQDLGSVLKDGAKGLRELREQAEKYGIIINKDVLQGAEKVNDALNVLWKTVRATFASILGSSSESLEELILKIAEFVAKSRAHINIWLDNNEAAFNEFTGFFKNLYKTIVEIFQNLDRAILATGIGALLFGKKKLGGLLIASTIDSGIADFLNNNGFTRFEAALAETIVEAFAVIAAFNAVSSLVKHFGSRMLLAVAASFASGGAIGTAIASLMSFFKTRMVTAVAASFAVGGSVGAAIASLIAMLRVRLAAAVAASFAVSGGVLAALSALGAAMGAAAASGVALALAAAVFSVVVAATLVYRDGDARALSDGLNVTAPKGTHPDDDNSLLKPVKDYINKPENSGIKDTLQTISDFFGITGKASGGFISGPGSGTSDSIPAMLSNGEYVVNAKATKMYGPLLEQLNAKGLKNGGYAEGGIAHTPQNVKDVTTLLSLAGLEASIENTNAVLASNSITLKEYVQNLDDADFASGNFERSTKDAIGIVRQAIETANSFKAPSNNNDDATSTAPTSEDLRKIKEEYEERMKALRVDGLRAKLDVQLSSVVDQFKLFNDANQDSYDKRLQQLAEYIESGSITASEGYVQALQAQKEFEQQKQEIFREYGPRTLRKAFEESFGEGSFQGLRDNIKYNLSEAFQSGDFKSAIKGIFSNVAKLFADRAASQFDALLFGDSNGVGGFLSGLLGFSSGGIVPKPGQRPQYFASGGVVRGTDTVAAMLTPGEMVLNKEQQGMMGGDTYNIKIEAIDTMSFESRLGRNPKLISQIAEVGRQATTGIR